MIFRHGRSAHYALRYLREAPHYLADRNGLRMRVQGVRLLMLGWFVWLLTGCGGGTSSSGTDTPNYRITDLGPSSALDLYLNNLGEIAAYDGSAFIGKGHAALYRNGQWQDLGTLRGVYSYATGINDQGEVIGFSELPYVPGNITYHAFVWRNEQITDLSDLASGTDLRPTGINNAGQIVGTNGAFGGFLWAKGVFKALPLLPSAINNRGQVIGQTELGGPLLLWLGARDQRYRPGRWNDGYTFERRTGWLPVFSRLLVARGNVARPGDTWGNGQSGPEYQ
jgi:probable HAF family extracellular repeat protein